MNIVLTGGGTAGHIIPNLALVDDLKKSFDNIYYIGSNKPSERKLVEDYKIPFYPIDAPKFIRKFTLKNLCIPIKLLKCIKQCKKLLQELNADIIFSKGGYVSLPVIIAAKRLNLKIIIHESDSSLGLANKIASMYASKVCTSFDLKTNSPKYVYTGSPIRKEFLTPKKNVYFKNNKPTLLVMGGSQGSSYINDFIYDNIKNICSKYNVIHICGQNKSKSIINENYKQIEFSNDIANLIHSSDIVLTRGGSNALFEIATLNKAMIIVPLSTKSSRGEQIQNANYFLQNNLAVVMFKLEINEFLNTIEKELKNKNKIESLQNNLFKTNGNQNILNVIKECIIH